MSAIANLISDLESQAGLKGTDIANMTSVSKATISRWKTGKSAPSPSNQLVLSDLKYITQRLSEYYESDEIRLWLNSPHPQLEGMRAIDLIHDEKAVEVLEIIGRLDGDAYL